MTDVEARDLKPGQRITAGFLPLRGEAVVLYVKPYPIHAVTRVFVVYEYTDVDAYGIQPTPDDYLPDTLIPVEGCATHGRIPREGCCSPREFKPGDRFLLPAGNGKLVRTGTILSWQNPINPRSEGSWFVEVDAIPEAPGITPAAEGWKSWFKSADLLPADASQADIDAYVAERQARWFKPGPITLALHRDHDCDPYHCTTP
jgi:hypothetical protein